MSQIKRLIKVAYKGFDLSETKMIGFPDNMMVFDFMVPP